MNRVEELVGVPARRQWTGLCFAIADDAGHEQVRIVERRSECVRQRVAKLPTFMDRAGRFRGDVARNPARERELREEPLHALFIL